MTKVRQYNEGRTDYLLGHDTGYRKICPGQDKYCLKRYDEVPALSGVTRDVVVEWCHVCLPRQKELITRMNGSFNWRAPVPEDAKELGRCPTKS